MSLDNPFFFKIEIKMLIFFVVIKQNMNDFENEEEKFEELVMLSNTDTESSSGNIDDVISISSEDTLDYSMTDDLYEDVENIFYDEEIFIDSEKKDGLYYIGLVTLLTNPDEWIMDVTVTAKSFLKYKFIAIEEYLEEYRTNIYYRGKVDIMRLHISETGSYSVTIKTYWIKIIQRTWKRIYKSMEKELNRRKNPIVLLNRSLQGSWGTIERFPQIRKMLKLKII